MMKVGMKQVAVAAAMGVMLVPVAYHVVTQATPALAGVASAVCGNGVVEADEDCDLGGTCIGGPAAGTACLVGGATCTGGTCTTFGGKGCAANCTTEHDVPYPMVPGSLYTCSDGPNIGKACLSDDDCPDATCDPGLTVAPGTSGVVITETLVPPALPIPFGSACVGGTNANRTCTSDAGCPGGACVPSQQVLTVGREKNGKIPVVIKASSIKIPGIPVLSLACGCIHGIESKTCGGTFFEPDGTTPSPNCTAGFSSCTTAACDTDGEPCFGKAPCAFVHGEGNTASGEIGCADGLDDININFEQDSGGASGPCAQPNTCPPTVTLSGHGGPGSALLFQTLGITATVNACTGKDNVCVGGSNANNPCTSDEDCPGGTCLQAVYGPDGVYCTADDPPGGLIALAGTLPVATGNATAVVHNANGMTGTDMGPVSVTGAPFSCPALECGDQSSAAGGGLVGAFAVVHIPPSGGVSIGDLAVTAQLFASGTLPTTPQCLDSDRDGLADTADNCPYAFNPGQEDTGGIGATSVPDGIGDACQCGDVNGNGRVTVGDSVIVLRSLLSPPTATQTKPELCDVGGSAACSVADSVIALRANLSPPTATVLQHCAAANPPPTSP